MEKTDTRLKPRDIGNKALLVKLERTTKNLQQLKNKLSSYTCEPKTWKLFEQKERLRSRLDDFVSTNSELISSGKLRQRETDAQIDRIKQQLREFSDLQRSILEYIGRARQHC